MRWNALVDSLRLDSAEEGGDVYGSSVGDVLEGVGFGVKGLGVRGEVVVIVVAWGVSEALKVVPCRPLKVAKPSSAELARSPFWRRDL